MCIFGTDIDRVFVSSKATKLREMPSSDSVRHRKVSILCTISMTV